MRPGLPVDSTARPASSFDDERALLVARAIAGSGAVLVSLLLVSAAELRLGFAGHELFWSLRAGHLLYVIAGLFKGRLRISRPAFERLLVVELLGTFLFGGATAVLHGDASTGPVLFLVIGFGCATTLPWGALPQAAVAGLGFAAWCLVNREVAGSWATVASPLGMAIGIAFATTVYIAFLLAQHRRELAEKACELAAARDEALGSSRAKSEFLANMSHEVRTPIHVVFGMLDILAEEGPLGTTQADALRRARLAAGTLLSLIDGVLDLSKIDAGKVVLESTDFDLRATLAEVVDILGPRARDKGLDLVCRFAPGLPERLRGDPHRLRQVVTNLVGNALKFTERGGVVLRVDVVSVTAADVTARISVTDTGIGIPADRQAAIFESFTQADGSTTRRYGGSGLGLTISGRLVELMGGTLVVESEPGRGSTFAFTLRLERATTAGDEERSEPRRATG